jgi:hypothetical protein
MSLLLASEMKINSIRKIVGNLMYHYLCTVAVAIRNLNREYLISGLKGTEGSLCLTPAVLNALEPSMTSLIEQSPKMP